MKRVLLTGATGFIGRSCLPLLIAKGYEVHAVSSRLLEAEDEVRQTAHWHQVDLLDPVQAAKLMAEVQPSQLLHLAWYAIPGKYWTSLENLRWVQASLGLLQAFREQGGQRVVVAGSCAEYDWGYGYCNEQLTPASPATLYGTAKHALQLLLAQSGLSSAWGRVFFLYGPHEPPQKLVAAVAHALLQGEPARTSHGNQLRDFLYVEDVASAFVAMLESGVRGPVNIASGQPVSLKHIIYTLAEQIGRPDLVQLGAIAAPPEEPPLLVGDNRRLMQETDWSPQYDLGSGLAKTINWWKEQLAQEK
jgi:nucleoside-diphosphate-sugar epimerase